MSKRVDVVQEGNLLVGHNLVLLLGALQMPDRDRLPVTAAYDHTRVVGIATNMQRTILKGTATAVISFDIAVLDDGLDFDKVDWSVSTNDIVRDHKTISRATIREITYLEKL